MAIEQRTNAHRSRRAILAGGLGAVGALAARALAGGLDSARAADGDFVKIGTTNLASHATTIKEEGADTYVSLVGELFGVIAKADAENGVGVEAIATGTNCMGVWSPVSGAYAIGVKAETTGDATQAAVRAESIPDGIAVDAVTHNGAAIRAFATGGFALDITGLVSFDRSGRLVVQQGHSSRAVDYIIVPATTVVATLQGNVSGLWVRSVATDPARQRFTVYLNKPAPHDVSIGFFVLN